MRPSNQCSLYSVTTYHASAAAAAPRVHTHLQNGGSYDFFSLIRLRRCTRHALPSANTLRSSAPNLKWPLDKSDLGPSHL